MTDPKLIIWSPVRRTDVAWNFEKFLVGKDGEVAARFKTGVQPSDAAFIAAVEAALAR